MEEYKNEAMEKITFQSVNFKASSTLEGFAKDKVAKLFEQDNSLIRADITLFLGASGNIYNNFCEIYLSVPGENHFVKKNTERYEDSIVDAVAALQKILRRKKTKKITNRRR